MINYFEGGNRKSKNENIFDKVYFAIEVSNFVVFVTSSTSVALSVTGFGLLILALSSRIACRLTLT